MTEPHLETEKVKTETTMQVPSDHEPETVALVGKLEVLVEQMLSDVEVEEALMEKERKDEKKKQQKKQWEEVDSSIMMAQKETKLLESEIEMEEVKEEKEMKKSFIEEKETDVRSPSIQFTDEEGDGEDSCGESSEPEEARAIKAEIKLLVKTTEMGKEAIEIHSIREFVDADESKGSFAGIFTSKSPSPYSPSPSSGRITDSKSSLAKSPTSSPQLSQSQSPASPMYVPVSTVSESCDISAGRTHQTDDLFHELIAQVRGHREGSHQIQEGQFHSTQMRGADHYQSQDPTFCEQYSEEQRGADGTTTSDIRSVRTTTYTTTVIGEDGQPVTTTSTETTQEGSEPDQLRDSMQTVLEQFLSGEKQEQQQQH